MPPSIHSAINHKMTEDNNYQTQQKSMWKRHRVSARILMRSVSIFVASSRRISNANRLLQANNTDNDGSDELEAETPSSEFPHQNVGKVTNTRTVASARSLHIAEKLKKKTHFTKKEIEKLSTMFKKLVAILHAEPKYHSTPIISQSKQKYEKGMDRMIFRELLHSTFHILTEEMIMDRIFNAFDRLSDGIIHLDEWILGLSIFMKGTIEEKIAFSFFVYDINSDGFITKEEIFALMRNSLMKLPQDEDPDENVKDFSDIVLRKLDTDRDNKISFQDFRSAVLKDNLLLEALGQCLPSEETVKQFFYELHAK